MSDFIYVVVSVSKAATVTLNYYKLEWEAREAIQKYRENNKMYKIPNERYEYKIMKYRLVGEV